MLHQRVIHFCASLWFASALIAISCQPTIAQIKTWDTAHAADKIEVTMVYFVPKDAAPLPDWKERFAYYAKRIEKFHQREFEGQSTLTTKVMDTPFVSSQTTPQLRRGDANAIFFRTLREVNDRLKFGETRENGFPILLVLSEINWRPLDDFFRVKPTDTGWQFEGNYNAGRHFPGAESGGARAVYLSDRGIGWGLVSGDGWRVPYTGSDCVVYHEGVGHTIGLPHNEPADAAVMSLGQYNGWINQSWVDRSQKQKLGWKATESTQTAADLFTRFTATVDPVVPKPNQEVQLKLSLPESATLKSCRVRIQTDLHGPWIEVVPQQNAGQGSVVAIGRFDRPTPVSYRVDVELTDGQREELWGYFQVREEETRFPIPATMPREPAAETSAARTNSIANNSVAITPTPTIDLLNGLNVEKSVSGKWVREGKAILSPKEFGARIELPTGKDLPSEYEMLLIVEPLDEPNGLILGQRISDQRFLVLLNYRPDATRELSAIENIDGENVLQNDTMREGAVFAKEQLVQIVIRVQKNRVTVHCDGQPWIDWQGDADRLSLSDYWSTPTAGALFIGAYDCRYRFHRISLRSLD